MVSVNKNTKLNSSKITISLLLIIAATLQLSLNCNVGVKLIRAKKLPINDINEHTKLLIINEANDIGYLIGKINPIKHSSNEPSNKQRTNYTAANEKGKHQTANYSVIVASPFSKHIAILLEVEELLQIEPSINCDNQELQFELVGNIEAPSQLKASNKVPQLSNQTVSQTSEATILTKNELAALKLAHEIINEKESSDSSKQASNKTDSSSSLNKSTGDEEDEAAESEEAQKASKEAETDDEVGPITSIGEIIAEVLNKPVNESSLDANGTFSLQQILRTGEILFAETCLQAKRHYDLSRRKQQHSRRPRLVGADSKQPQNSNSQSQSKLVKRDSTISEGTWRRISNLCSNKNEYFVEKLSQKLNRVYKWAEFKKLCTRTNRQLLIPTRMFKLNVYGDVFSPEASFKIKYKFVSNISELPMFDNGKFYCRNRNVIELSQKCNYIDDCGDASDETTKLCGYRDARSSIATLVERSTTSAHQAHKKLAYADSELNYCCDNSKLSNKNVNSRRSKKRTNTMEKHARIKTRVKRIVGGEPTTIKAWPSQASLQLDTIESMSHFCAATLIHPQYVMTAAHCISRDLFSSGVRVVFGLQDLRNTSSLNDSDGSVQIRYAEDAVTYPGLNVKHLRSDWETDMNNDIALVRLNAPVHLTEHVMPACMPLRDTERLSQSTKCTAIGWGLTHGSGSALQLKQVGVKIANSKICMAAIERDFEVSNIHSSDKSRRKLNPTSNESTDNLSNDAKYADDSEDNLENPKVRVKKKETSIKEEQFDEQTMICGLNESGHSICSGDSGGPLICEQPASDGSKCNQVVGVASFVIQYSTVASVCAVDNLPGFFSSTASKTNWLQASIRMLEQSKKLESD